MKRLLALMQKIPTNRIVSDAPKSTPTRRLLGLMFGKYLLLTNTVSSGLLMVVGDAVAQKIEFDRAVDGTKTSPIDINVERVGHMFVVGSVQGPIQHYFYTWLDQRFVSVTTAGVAKKILLDQLIMSPICIVTFFATASLVEKESLEKFRSELTTKFLPVYISDWMIWPFAQFLNFRFVPAPYRVMYINAITMIYNVWLSFVKHNDLDVGNYMPTGRCCATNNNTDGQKQELRSHKAP